jgi:PII-like signaling protein
MGIGEPTTILQGIFGFGRKQQHNEHITVRRGSLPCVWLREKTELSLLDSKHST